MVLKIIIESCGTSHNQDYLRCAASRQLGLQQTFGLTARSVATLLPTPHYGTYRSALRNGCQPWSRFLRKRCCAKPFYARPNVANSRNVMCSAALNWLENILINNPALKDGVCCFGKVYVSGSIPPLERPKGRGIKPLRHE